MSKQNFTQSQFPYFLYKPATEYIPTPQNKNRAQFWFESGAHINQSVEQSKEFSRLKQNCMYTDFM